MSNILLALQITGIGMGLVFGAILILWLMMILLTRLTADTPASLNESASDSGGIDVQYHEPYDAFHDATILRGGEMNNYFKGKIVNNSSHSVGNYPFILLADKKPS